MQTLTLDENHIYRLDGRITDGLTATISEAGLIREGDPWYMDRGTAVHRATELWDKGTLDEATVDPQIVGYVESWKRFRADLAYTPTHIEHRTYHPHLLVGMTIDRLPLLDIKSGSWDKWHSLQLACAWDALRAQGMSDNCLNPMGVYLDADGGPPKVRSYTVREMRDAFMVYAGMLAFLRWRR